jgi:hypothetical protein
MPPRKPHTHVLWIQKWEGGKFREWLPAGKGRIDIDAQSSMVAHNFQDMTVIGPWNGYTCLLPAGSKPPLPPSPKRPQAEDDEEDESLGMSTLSARLATPETA